MLRVARRGFNPLDSAKKLGQTNEGKVVFHALANMTVVEQDESSKEPKAKRSRVVAGAGVLFMIRVHILLNLRSRWETILSDVGFVKDE